MNLRKISLLVLVLGIAPLLCSCAVSNRVSLIEHPAKTAKWQDLVAEDLSNCTLNQAGSWEMNNGELALVNYNGGWDIWTKDTYGDFILDLEFKVSEGANSGVFFRTANIRDMVMTGIEAQILDSYGSEADKHSCGAIYDCLAPMKNTAKPTGEWNRMTITCLDNKIYIVMNDELVINMDLNLWTEAHKNPDGTRNKFNKAYKEMARAGHIGFQDHGHPVWYRNMKILPLN